MDVMRNSRDRSYSGVTEDAGPIRCCLVCERFLPFQRIVVPPGSRAVLELLDADD